MKYLLLTLIALSLQGCRSLPDDWYIPFYFRADNHKYFPDFIQKFFPMAEKFEQEHRLLSEASKGFRLIEIKALMPQNIQGSEANLAWSRNGRFLSYERKLNLGNNIEIRELSGKYQQVLSTNSASPNFDPWVKLNYKSYNSGLSWSQDEQSFAFISNGSHGNYNIFIGGLKKTPYPITSSNERNGFAKWSPKGKEIAYISSKTGNGDLYIFNLDKKHETHVWSSSHMELFPEWMPKKSGLVFNSGPSNQHQIMIIVKDKDQWQSPRYLTQWPNDNLRPTFSPDGRWVAFFGSNEAGGWDLYVLPLTERIATAFDMTKHIIARNVILDLNTGPAWSPSGDYIFFISKDLQLFNPIYAYHLNSGIQYRLQTHTKMNRDLMVSKHGVLSFRAQVGAWDKIFVALTNLGLSSHKSMALKKISYHDPEKPTYLASYISKEEL